MDTQAKSDVLHVRLPNDVLKKLKNFAKRDGRTVSGTAAWILKQWVTGQAK